MQEYPYKIFNASAGSGKTYTLVKEYLKTILSSKSRWAYQKILCVTFTNKAVSEMKQRILSSLFEFGNTTNFDDAPPMFNDLVKELDTTPEHLQNQSKKLLHEILHNYAFFDISTIDKFYNRLIRSFAKELKLPQNFEVLLDTELLLDEAVTRLIEKAGEDSELTTILVDFALEKIDDDKSWDIAFDLNKIGKLLFDENHASHLNSLKDKKITDFLELKKTLKTALFSSEKDIIKNADGILQIIQTNGLEVLNFKSGYFPKFIIKIKKGDFKVDFNAKWKQNFATDSLYAKNCPDATKSILDSLQTKFVLLFDEIKAQIYHSQFLRNAYNNINPLTVLSEIQHEIKGLESERNQLHISAFNSIISKEIKNQPAPFIYERLGEKYRHYFIDEFQDTSLMQWENLLPLISNALESEDLKEERGSLFLVGDVKQAIYRWRGGRAELLLNLASKKDNPFLVAPKVSLLPKNHRSHEEIINFNNNFFSHISQFLEHSAYEALFVEGNKQEINAKTKGLVQLTFIEKENDENEVYCNEVLLTIKNVRENNYQLKDICILVRDNKNGVLLANFLAKEQIPIISADSLLLSNNEQVAFLIHLLRTCQQPENLETQYQILYHLSPKKENVHDFIYKNLGALNYILQKDFGFNMDFLRHSSVFDGLEYAIKIFNLTEKSSAYLIYFMDLVLDIEKKEGVGIAPFLKFWDKKKDNLSIPAPENIDAIQIITVHKAKGLEFPVVIFPFANSYIYKEKDKKLWLPSTIKNSSFKEVLVNKKKEMEHYGQKAYDIYHEEQHKLQLDALNVLYVALTRAVKALYIITKKDLDTKGNHKTDYYSGLFIDYLIKKNCWNSSQNTYPFGSLPSIETSSNNKVVAQNITYVFSHKENPKFKLHTKSGSLWGSSKEEAIAKGNLVHFLLGLIETEKDVQKALRFMVAQGHFLEEEMPYYNTLVTEVINHPKLAAYYKDGNIIKNEMEIILDNGQLVRPDRVVIRNNIATIIDYKTGTKSVLHKEQVALYSQYISDMGYEIGGKIIIYLSHEVEIEYA